MTARFLRYAAASFKLVEIEEMNIPPTLMPANYGAGRFVWYALARGYGYPNLGTDFAEFFMLWDWNSAANRYELVNCLPRYSTSPALDYTPAQAGVISFVDATSVVICNPAQASGLNMARMLLTISAAPSISMTFSGQNTAAYSEPGVAASGSYRSNPVAYSGSLLYGLGASGYPASNGYVQKVSSAAASRNSTALRTGLPTENSQGVPGKAIAALGGAVPNGYVVVEVDDNVSATCRYQLVNCTGTPVAVGSQLAYAGGPAAFLFNRVVSLGASKVVAFDYEAAASRPRASLLNTNSATAPTTLTKGAEVYLPVPPGKAASDVQVVLMKSEKMAANSWMVEGKTVVLALYYFVDGTTKLYAVLIESTSTSTITATILTTDISGRDLTTPKTNPNSGFVVSAPGGKAVVFVQLGSVNGGNQHQQYVYQL